MNENEIDEGTTTTTTITTTTNNNNNNNNSESSSNEINPNTIYKLLISHIDDECKTTFHCNGLQRSLEFELENKSKAPIRKGGKVWLSNVGNCLEQSILEKDYPIILYGYDQFSGYVINQSPKCFAAYSPSVLCYEASGEKSEWVLLSIWRTLCTGRRCDAVVYNSTTEEIGRIVNLPYWMPLQGLICSTEFNTDWEKAYSKYKTWLIEFKWEYDPERNLPRAAKNPAKSLRKLKTLVHEDRQRHNNKPPFINDK